MHAEEVQAEKVKSTCMCFNQEKKVNSWSEIVTFEVGTTQKAMILFLENTKPMIWVVYINLFINSLDVC